MQNAPNKKSVLITGGSGFTGQHLTKDLTSKGYSVVNMSIQAGDSKAVADITNPGAVDDFISNCHFDAVIHLAAISFVAHEDVHEVYDVNVIGTRNLLSALAKRNSKPESVILASTSNVYGRTEGFKLNENFPPKPSNDYAISKLAMEYVAGMWSDVLPITITRPFNYTGVGQSVRFLIPKIVDHFKRGEASIELGNLEVSRDFLDVRDVVSIYSSLLEKPSPGQTFNIASGNAISIRQIIEMMNKIAGYQIEIVSKPELQRATDIAFLSGDSSKLWNHLGAEYTRPLQDTLTWMFEN